MRRMTYGSTATAAGVLVLAGSAATAGPLNPKHIPDSARWVAHVDLEAGAASEIGRFLLDAIDEDTEGYKDIRQGLPGFTLAPEGGIDGMTIFGRSFDEDGPEEFVAYIYGDERIGAWGDQIDNALRQGGQDPASIEVEGRRAWGIPIEDGEETIFATLLSKGDARTWIISNNLLKVSQAAAFVDKGGGDGGALDGFEWRPGTIAMVGVKDPGKVADFEEMSAVIGRAKSITARVGERDGEFFAEAKAVTEDAEGADQIARVLDGFVALGSMMQSNDPELARLMRFSKSLHISGEGGAVRVTFEHDAGEVLGLIRQLKEEGDDDVELHFGHGDDHDGGDDD